MGRFAVVVCLLGCGLVAGPGAAVARAESAPGWWEERNAEEREIIIDELYQSTGHPAPYSDRADSARRVTDHLRDGTPPSQTPDMATDYVDVAIHSLLLAPKPKLVPQLLRGGATGVAAGAIVAISVYTGQFLYARWTANELVGGDFEWDYLNYRPPGFEIYYGATSHGAWLFDGRLNGNTFNPVRWFEEPCTFSSFQPPSAAHMRVGVPANAECRFPINEPPFYADAPVFVDYPYLNAEDIGLEDWPRIGPYKPYDYSVPGVPLPPLDESEEELERALEADGKDELRRALLTAIVTERIERNNADDETRPDPTGTAVLAEECIAFVMRADLHTSDCGTPDLPILSPGSNHGEATGHVLEALEDRPIWMKLRFLEKGPNSEWYAKYPQTNGDPDQKCRGTFPTTACDEYPMWATDEGGDHPEPLRPHLKIIDFGQNSGLGSKFGQFASKCRLQERRTAPPQFGLGYFLVVPQHVIPTVGLCNGPNP